MNKLGIRFLLGALLLLPSFTIQAQRTGLQIAIGRASFRMDDMKYLQEYILSNYPVEGKIISSFPSHNMVGVNLIRKPLPNIKVGVGYAFSTTGGKMNYTDYSGSLSTYIIASSYRLGAFISYDFLSSERLDLALFGRLDANMSQTELTTYLSASGYSNSASEKYRAISPNGSVGFELGYNLKNISLGLEGGYLVDRPGSLENVDNKRKFKDPVNNQRVLTTDWTGWRVALKANLWFSL